MCGMDVWDKMNMAKPCIEMYSLDKRCIAMAKIEWSTDHLRFGTVHAGKVNQEREMKTKQPSTNHKR